MTGVKTMAAYNRGLARREAAHPSYLPTPKQITAACGKIRQTWRETDKRFNGPAAVEVQQVADRLFDVV